MGEEQKEEEKKEEEKKEEVKEEEKKGGGEKKEEEKKEEEPPEIVLKVFMHCGACAKKVERSLRKFEGVEEVKADSRASKVVVKGKTADPLKICERVQKRTGRKTELISPLPKQPEEEKKEEEPKEEEKKEEPTPITVILKVKMHCEDCARVLQKRIKKMEGVESVATDLPNDQVIVKGFIDPAMLVENVYRRTRKQASIVKDEEQKEEEKKPEEEKKEEKAEEEKKEEEVKEEDDTKVDDIKKSEYWHTKYYTEYVHAPQIFSDENPNACSLM